MVRGPPALRGVRPPGRTRVGVGGVSGQRPRGAARQLRFEARSAGRSRGSAATPKATVATAEAAIAAVGGWREGSGVWRSGGSADGSRTAGAIFEVLGMLGQRFEVLRQRIREALRHAGGQQDATDPRRIEDGLHAERRGVVARHRPGLLVRRDERRGTCRHRRPYDHSWAPSRQACRTPNPTTVRKKPISA